MKQEDKEKALAWYKDHKEHVDKLIVSCNGGYKPSSEDIIEPALWKPSHWKWFLNSEYSDIHKI